MTQIQETAADYEVTANGREGKVLRVLLSGRWLGYLGMILMDCSISIT